LENPLLRIRRSQVRVLPSVLQKDWGFAGQTWSEAELPFPDCVFGAVDLNYSATIIFGEQAVEVVQLVATAMRGGMPVEEIADIELAYPTFTAIVGLVARRAARELGVTIAYRGWSLQSQLGVAEWELGKDHDKTAAVL
jgi:hypothetical protein